LADALGGRGGVLLVDRAAGREGVEVAVEGRGRRDERAGDRGQVGGHPQCRVGLAGRLRLDRVGGQPEEVPDHPQGELLLAAGQRVQGALRAVQPDGEVLEGEPGEALGEEQRLELVEQLRPAAGQAGLVGRHDGGRRHGTSSRTSMTAGLRTVLRYRPQYCFGGARSTVLVERELPTDEARDLLALTRELADAELAPRAAQYERE